MSNNNARTLSSEPLAPTMGWKATLDVNNGDFYWVKVIYDGTKITAPVVACVQGYNNSDKHITPVVFTHSGQMFPILGNAIKASGNDSAGNAFTTTSGVTFYVYRGY